MYFVILASVLFVFSGCHSGNGKVRSRSSIKAIIDSAQIIMDYAPERACQLLEEVDQVYISGREQKAFYALLYSEALYKSYQAIESDSLIMTAVKYYSVHKDTQKLFRSYYCLGCIYADKHCYTDAAVALLQAEKLVDFIDDEFRKGLLYMQMGAVFFDSFDFKRAQPYYSKAVTSFAMCGKDYHRICALGEIGRCRMQLEDYKGAMEYFDKVLEWEGIEEYPENMSQYLVNKMTCYFMSKDYVSARSEIERYISLFGIPENDSRSLGMMARCYILDHDVKDAGYYLEKAWGNATPADSINLFFVSSLIEEELGNLKAALDYYRLTISLQNRQLNLQLDNPVVGAQRDYYRTVSELEEIKTRNKDILIASCFIILGLMAFSFYFFSRYRKQQTDLRIRDYLLTISQLTEKECLSQETISDLNQRIFELSAWESINKEKIKSLNLKVRNMLRQQFTPSDYLYTRFYEQIDDNKKAERLYKVVKKQIDDFTGPASISRLDALLNETFGIIMADLSAQLALKEKELLLLRFVLAGFSAKSIAAILNDSHQNINQRKKRLLDKIRKKDPHIMETFGIALKYK